MPAPSLESRQLSNQRLAKSRRHVTKWIASSEDRLVPQRKGCKEAPKRPSHLMMLPTPGKMACCQGSSYFIKNNPLRTKGYLIKSTSSIPLLRSSEARAGCARNTRQSRWPTKICKSSAWRRYSGPSTIQGLKVLIPSHIILSLFPSCLEPIASSATYLCSYMCCVRAHEQQALAGASQNQAGWWPPVLEQAFLHFAFDNSFIKKWCRF